MKILLMVEVFKTDVQELADADQLRAQLLQHFPDNKISFDLEDCDRVLRVEGESFMPEELVKLVRQYGFSCNVLE